MAVAFEAWRSEFCSQCGTRSTDWMGPDGIPVHPPPWEVGTDRCVGCEEAQRMSDHLGDKPKPETRGMRVVFRRPGWRNRDSA